MRNKWGRIINISSTGGLRGEIGTSLYTSSKNASLGYLKFFLKNMQNLTSLLILSV